MEKAGGYGSLPPFDLEDRHLTVERVLPSGLAADQYARADYDPVHSWANADMKAEHREADGAVEVTLRTRGTVRLVKLLRISGDGTVDIRYRWDAGAFPPEAWFAPEISTSTDVELRTDPPVAHLWRHEIRSLSKSEKGPEETVQGLSITPLWPCALGEARLAIGATNGPGPGR
jgi:hypothetical protein